MKHILTFCIAILAAPAFADTPKIEQVHANRSDDGWRFSVTLSHTDEGWDHYADAWQVEDANGKVLGLRDLAHPNQDEQPLTRSLSGVQIRDGVNEVFVRARCNVDGLSNQTFAVTLR